MIQFPKRIGSFNIFGNLGSGGYGQVFVGRESKTFQNFAIKVSADHESLSKEFKILKTLSNSPQFLKVFEYGKIGSFDYFVMELLGKNFQYKQNEKLFSLRTVACIGLEILERIEKMHSLDIIHKDIKPSQFLLSHDRTKIYLVDFGMATFFREGSKHKTFKTRCKFKGSVMFASINNHMGFRQSRRDDLECLCYSLIYLIKGELPWVLDSRVQGFKKWKLILNQKVCTKKDSLFQNVPCEFETFYKYTRRLLYDQSPNYSYLKSLLQKFIQNEPLYMNFDWIINPKLFSKVESYVEVTEEKSVLHLKNIDGEFFSKRRNGKVDVCTIRKGSKSVTFKCNEKGLVFENSRNPSIDQKSEKKENSEEGSTESIETKNKKKRSKTSFKRDERKNKKKRIKTCDKIIDLLKSDQQIDSTPVKSPTYILPDISFGPSDSVLNTKCDEESGTPKMSLPEFKNKQGVLQGRWDFIQYQKCIDKEDKCTAF
jgi:serine/threonine protein kinase